MGIYTDAIKRPENIILSNREALLVDTDKLANVGLVAVRSGGVKGKTIGNVLSDFGLPISIIPSQYDEDAKKGRGFMRQSRTTAAKTVDWQRDIRLDPTINLEPGKNVISLATDVHQIVYGSDGIPKILDKPGSTTKDNIAAEINSTFKTDGNTKFIARTSVASLFKDPSYPEEPGIGLTTQSQVEFEASKPSPEELQIYVHGINGVKNPKTLEALGIISNEYDAHDEITILENGLSLAELKSTNGGIRWLHPVFSRYIERVNGIEKGQQGFENELNKLWSTLLGIPLEKMLKMISNGVGTSSWFEDSDHLRSLYSEPVASHGEETGLPGVWKKMVELKSGWPVILEKMSAVDIPGMVTLAHLNFTAAHSKNLAHVESYIAANTPDKFLEVFASPEYQEGRLFILGARAANRELAGYIIANKDGREIKIKRVHTALPYQGKGVAGQLIQEVLKIGKERGCEVAIVKASGNSPSMFAASGFQSHGVFSDRTGVFKDAKVPPTYALMSKDLSMVV